MQRAGMKNVEGRIEKAQVMNEMPPGGMKNAQSKE
jgi:hypothetical protein